MPKICREGYNNIFNCYFGSATKPSNFYVGLYSNTIEPATSATLTDIIEISYPDYSRQQITSWSFDNNYTGWALASDVIFTIGETQWDFTGYFITTVATGTSGILLSVFTYSTPKSLLNTTHTIKINFTHTGY